MSIVYINSRDTFRGECGHLSLINVMIKISVLSGWIAHIHMLIYDIYF